MSDKHDLPIALQLDRQGHVPCLPRRESDSGLPRPYADDTGRNSDELRPSRSMAGDVQTTRGVRVKERDSLIGLPRSDDTWDPDNSRRLDPEQASSTGFGEAGVLGGVVSNNRSGFCPTTSGPNHMRTVLSINTEGASERRRGRHGEDGTGADADEEGEMEEDDDVDAATGEMDSASQPQTVEERLAARRKMKRFRLTHQQTRFLMSEFSKQAHPDAAHRERLSREIPGLSPRQVQVWFQNRRAKIKRLTADDRDRVVRMRAVPDGFDNVQALHSPYGAVHGLAIPASPGDAVSTPYGGQMLRPLMVDVQRQEEAYMASSVLAPSFGDIELGQPGSSILSPLSPASSNKFGTECHLSSSSRTPSVGACHQGGLDGVGQVGKPRLRPVHPLQMRESVGRSTPDSLLSPLRGGMPWKPDSLDYPHYQAAGSASSATDRHPSIYQADHVGPAPDSGLGSFEHSYSGNYSGLSASQFRPRTRASSASFPLDTDLRIRGTFRPPDSGPKPSQYPCGVVTAPSTKADDATMFSTPLSATTILPHSRAYTGRASSNEGQSSHLSSPMTASRGFGRAFHTNLGGQQAHGGMRDYFGNSPM